MSRSRKKIAVWKDANNKYQKRLSNKRIRHLSIPSGGAFKKVLNPWDICDYRWLIPAGDESRERSLRK
jgi:hypothetical protein